MSSFFHINNRFLRNFTIRDSRAENTTNLITSQRIPENTEIIQQQERSDYLPALSASFTEDTQSVTTASRNNLTLGTIGSDGGETSNSSTSSSTGTTSTYISDNDSNFNDDNVDNVSANHERRFRSRRRILPPPILENRKKLILIRTSLILVGSMAPLLFEMCQLRIQLRDYLDRQCWILLRAEHNPILKYDVAARLPTELIEMAILLGHANACSPNASLRKAFAEEARFSPESVRASSPLPFHSPFSSVSAFQTTISKQDRYRAKALHRNNTKHETPEMVTNNTADKAPNEYYNQIQFLRRTQSHSQQSTSSTSTITDSHSEVPSSFYNLQFNNKQKILLQQHKKPQASGNIDLNDNLYLSITYSFRENTYIAREPSAASYHQNDSRWPSSSDDLLSRYISDGTPVFFQGNREYRHPSTQAGTTWPYDLRHVGICLLRLSQIFCESSVFLDALHDPVRVCASSGGEQQITLSAFDAAALSKRASSEIYNSVLLQKNSTFERLVPQQQEWQHLALLTRTTTQTKSFISSLFTDLITTPRKNHDRTDNIMPLMNVTHNIRNNTCSVKHNTFFHLLASLTDQNVALEKSTDELPNVCKRDTNARSDQRLMFQYSIKGNNKSPDALPYDSAPSPTTASQKRNKLPFVLRASLLENDVTPSFMTRFVIVALIFARWILAELRAVVEMFLPPLLAIDLFELCSVWSFKSCNTVYTYMKRLFYKARSRLTNNGPVRNYRLTDENEQLQSQTAFFSPGFAAMWRTLSFCINYLWSIPPVVCLLEFRLDDFVVNWKYRGVSLDDLLRAQTHACLSYLLIHILSSLTITNVLRDIENFSHGHMEEEAGSINDVHYRPFRFFRVCHIKKFLYNGFALCLAVIRLICIGFTSAVAFNVVLTGYRVSPIWSVGIHVGCLFVETLLRVSFGLEDPDLLTLSASRQITLSSGRIRQRQNYYSQQTFSEAMMPTTTAWETLVFPTNGIEIMKQSVLRYHNPLRNESEIIEHLVPLRHLTLNSNSFLILGSAAIQSDTALLHNIFDCITNIERGVDSGEQGYWRFYQPSTVTPSTQPPVREQLSLRQLEKWKFKGDDTPAGPLMLLVQQIGPYYYRLIKSMSSALTKKRSKSETAEGEPEICGTNKDCHNNNNHSRDICIKTGSNVLFSALITVSCTELSPASSSSSSRILCKKVLGSAMKSALSTTNPPSLLPSLPNTNSSSSSSSSTASLNFTTCCYVCMTSNASAVMFPCMHGGCCLPCGCTVLSTALNRCCIPKCPLCRQPVRAIAKIEAAVDPELFQRHSPPTVFTPDDTHSSSLILQYIRPLPCVTLTSTLRLLRIVVILKKRHQYYY